MKIDQFINITKIEKLSLDDTQGTKIKREVKQKKSVGMTNTNLLFVFFFSLFFSSLSLSVYTYIFLKLSRSIVQHKAGKEKVGLRLEEEESFFTLQSIAP